MKKTISIFLLLTVIAWTIPTPMALAVNESAENSTGSEAVSADNQVVVLYESSEMPIEASEAKSEKVQTRILEDAQTEILDEAFSADYTIEDTIVIEADEASADDVVLGVIASDSYSTDEMIEKLQDNESVKYVEPNYIYKACEISDWNDNYINEAWQLGEKGINADKAPNPASEGSPVVVAVVDTGIDYSHPELEERMWDAPDDYKLKKGMHGVDYSDYDDDPMDENGHGTHCAGIIAAAADNNEGIAGVAGKSEKTELMAVRVLDESGSGYLEDIVKGFNHVISDNQEGVNIKAINCSLGAPVTSEIFDEVLEQAGQNGIITVAAAGNDGTNNDTTLTSPANSKSDYVISVASTDSNGKLASYSNYGRKTVDLAAPGTNILSAVSYYNYAPCLYDSETIQKTTRVYGEFDESGVTKDDDNNYYATPVLGTDYSNHEITGVEVFGESKSYSVLSKNSRGKSSLEFVESNSEPFGIGNNDSLRWRISDAELGDEFLLFFPYEKLKKDEECFASAVFKSHTGTGDSDGTGMLQVGDIRITDKDPRGNITWESTAEESEQIFPVASDHNGICRASGASGLLYGRERVNGIDPDNIGFGFAYIAGSKGDAYIDINSLAISDIDAEASDFGQYDVYSGTSMATPMVTAAAAVIAAANPNMDAESIKSTILSSTTSSNELKGKCSTGGAMDFASYSESEETSKPAVSSVKADFKGRKITIKGKGFGANTEIKAFKSASGDEVQIHKGDISIADSNTITISNAGFDGHGLIGSDIRFEISNGTKNGEGSFYIVKGLKPYNDEFNITLETEEEFFILDKEDTSYADENDAIPTEEDLLEESTMPRDLSYVTGANDLYKYSNTGDICYTGYDTDRKRYDTFSLGELVSDAIVRYANEASKTSKYWEADDGEKHDGFDYEVVGGPTYLGHVIYELIYIDLVDRDAYLLMGMDLAAPSVQWKVYYDSMAGLGSTPKELDFRGIDSFTMAGLNGKLYMMGSNSDEKYDEATDTYSVEIRSGVYSCEPNLKGTKWNKEADMPQKRTNGRAIVQNAKLYYMLTNDEEGKIDYNIYEFNGLEWKVAGKIPKALFADSKVAVLDLIAILFGMFEEGSDAILCATGIDEKGILFAGKSFDGPGDTFRFNTSSGKTEPIEYSLWQTISDRKIEGAAKGDKMFVEYTKDATEESIGKSFPIKSGYVTLEKEVYGDGTGIVMGGGSYTKGEKTKITVTPDSDSFIQSVHVDGSNPKLSKEYDMPTAKSRKQQSTTFTAKANGKLEVVFGKLSTKVIVPKTSIDKMVGTHRMEAFTDGTVSDVKWMSSNKKYAKVNSDGTITFKKAGVGKTVTLTATSVENSKLKATCKVKIKSREKKKFKWYKKKVTSKIKVLIDQPLGKKFAPKKFKTKVMKNESVKLTWAKSKKVNGYIVFRKTGKGRFVQIAKLGKAKKNYADKKVKKGKKYQYMIIGYKKVKGSKAIRISKPRKIKKVIIK